MDIRYLIVIAAAGLIFLAIIAFSIYSKFFKKPVENVLMELAGELKLNYYPGNETKPPFATGTYSGRGVTLDLLNEKGYTDRWHPHSRIVVSVDKNVKEAYIVAKRGRFYSRKLGEIKVKSHQFEDKYVYLASSPQKAEKIVTPDVASWIINLEMTFMMQDGHIEFHQDKHFENKERIKHIIDALVYIATMIERVK